MIRQSKVCEQISLALSVLWVFKASLAHAASPWVMEAGTSSFYTTYIMESFDEVYLGEEAASPIAVTEQSTVWLHFYHGLTDKTTVAVQMGHTASKWAASSFEYSGLADTKFSLVHELQNQYLDDKSWTVSILTGLTLGGTYERGARGRPHAPGDDTHGLEFALLGGRQLNEKFSAQLALGYRGRADAPNEVFYSAALHVALGAEFSSSIVLDGINALDGEDINGAGFAGDFFRTEEDRTILDWTVSFSRNRFVAIAGYGKVVDISGIAEARNTGDSGIVHISAGFHF